MKPFYLLTVFIAISIASAAQMTAGFAYSLSLPQKEMKENIRPVHSMNVILTSNVKKLPKLSFGVEVGLGLYASFTKDQDIRFPDGTGINTKVSYSSNVATGGVFTRYNFLKDAKVNPYVTGKLGYANFFSKVVVADPEDEDECKPLDKKTPIRDHSFFASYGAGLQIDVSSKKNRGNAWLDISVSRLHGSNLSYINVKDIKSHINNDPNTPVPTSDKSVPLSMRFVNVATQTIHEHQLAQVYTSPLRLMEIKIGARWRIDND
jgi:hypothetical protein